MNFWTFPQEGQESMRFPPARRNGGCDLDSRSDAHRESNRIVEQAISGSHVGTVPAALGEKLREHQKNLVELAYRLMIAGVDRKMIETSVDAMLDSYRRELTAATGALTHRNFAATGEAS
jgi:flagellar motor component MotA